MLDRISLTSVGILLVVAGFAAGRFLAYPATAVALVPDERPLVPTVVIDGIREGRLIGSFKGEARFFLGETQILAEDERFSIDASSLFTTYKDVLVPSWAMFVASKRGSRYYPVLSKQGSNLKVSNRVYFRSKEEAEAAGFTSAISN